MYTKIICPVDFSDAACNAMDYASKVARDFSLELFLLNVKPLLFPDLIGGNADWLREVTLESKERLNMICTETKTKLNIACNSEVVVTSSRFEKIISLAADEKSMIIMGTNGMDDLYQYFFGTNTFNVLKKVKCPLLLVPDYVSHYPIKELIYVWGFEEESKIYLEQVIHFAKLFNADIQFLHISKNNSRTPKDISNAGLEIAASLMKTNNICYSFDDVLAEDIVEATNIYMSQKENGILMLPVIQHSLLKNIFRRNKLKELSAFTSYPVIFIHEDKIGNTTSLQ